MVCWEAVFQLKFLFPDNSDLCLVDKKINKQQQNQETKQKMKPTTTRTTDNKTKPQATAALIYRVSYRQPNWVSVYWKPPLPFQLSVCILGLRNSPSSLDCLGFSLLGAGLRPPALRCSEGQDFKTERNRARVPSTCR